MEKLADLFLEGMEYILAAPDAYYFYRASFICIRYNWNKNIFPLKKTER